MSQNTSSATLDEYELTGKPTSLEELSAEAPDAVVDAFNELETWHHSVLLNSDGVRLLVGERAGVGTKSFRLYHVPENPNDTAVAGILALRRRYDEPTVLGFIPAGDEHGEETAVENITDLQLISDPDTDTLTEILDHLRTELTGDDWVTTGRADTDFGQWNDAIIALYEFYTNRFDDPPYTVTHQFMKGATMHAIARYPGDAEKLLSSAAMRLDRLEGNEDHGRYVNSPFALRRLLLDYAAVHLDTSHFPVNVTATTDSAE